MALHSIVTFVVLPILGTLLCYALLHTLHFVYKDLTSSLRHLNGPPNTSLLKGNFGEMAVDPKLTAKWRAQHGTNYVYRGLFSTRELYTADIKALSHIFAHPAVFQKTKIQLHFTQRLMGFGILSVELGPHKRQRRVLNQAFGPAQIRVLTETFVDKAIQLRDLWAKQLVEGGGTQTFDVFEWMRRMTLDVIGQAGFDYDFNALERSTSVETNELEDVLTALFHSRKANLFRAFRFAETMVPILQLFPTPGARAMDLARKKLDEVGYRIMSQSKEAIMNRDPETKLGLGDKRDLLSTLLKANLSPDVPASQQLSDVETMGQVPTFVFAGHETTSTALSWAMHALSLDKAVQTKLRQELVAFPSHTPSMDELNALPYLEAVTRETMRLFSPVGSTMRMACEDTVLPLGEVCIDKYGRAYDSIPIQKGQIIHIPIRAVNTDKKIWGEDADKFIPERWEHLPEAVQSIPGVWANLLTFLAGPHNCIGFRFSLIEFKATLFTLLRAFEFDPATEIGSSSLGIQKPLVKSRPEKGSSLPLVVRTWSA